MLEFDYNEDEVKHFRDTVLYVELLEEITYDELGEIFTPYGDIKVNPNSLPNN